MTELYPLYSGALITCSCGRSFATPQALWDHYAVADATEGDHHYHHQAPDPNAAATRQIGELARKLEEVQAELAQARLALASCESQCEHFLQQKLQLERAVVVLSDTREQREWEIVKAALDEGRRERGERLLFSESAEIDKAFNAGHAAGASVEREAIIQRLMDIGAFDEAATVKARRPDGWPT